MSASAADYYKVSALKNKGYNASLRADDAAEDLADAEEALARAREEVQWRKRLASALVDIEKDAEGELEEAEGRCKVKAGEIIDPRTGLKQGEKVEIVGGDGHEEYRNAIQLARGFMSKGMLDKALAAERMATLKSNFSDSSLNPKAVFLPLIGEEANIHFDTVQVREGERTKIFFK